MKNTVVYTGGYPLIDVVKVAALQYRLDTIGSALLLI